MPNNEAPRPSTGRPKPEETDRRFLWTAWLIAAFGIPALCISLTLMARGLGADFARQGDITSFTAVLTGVVVATLALPSFLVGVLTSALDAKGDTSLGLGIVVALIWVAFANVVCFYLPLSFLPNFIGPSEPVKASFLGVALLVYSISMGVFVVGAVVHRRSS